MILLMGVSDRNQKDPKAKVRSAGRMLLLITGLLCFFNAFPALGNEKADSIDEAGGMQQTVEAVADTDPAGGADPSAYGESAVYDVSSSDYEDGADGFDVYEVMADELAMDHLTAGAITSNETELNDDIETDYDTELNDIETGEAVINEIEQSDLYDIEAAGVICEDDEGLQDSVYYAAAPAAYSGQCGDTMYWSYEEDTGTLTITGEGEMWDFELTQEPWHALFFTDTERNLIVSDGVETIGNNAFRQHKFINVSLGKDIWKIGDAAFKGCNNIEELFLPEAVTLIGTGAFSEMYRPQGYTPAIHFTSEEPPEGIYGMARTPVLMFISETPAWREAYNNYTYTNNGPVWCYDLPSVKCGNGVYWHLTFDGRLQVKTTGERGVVTASSIGKYADKVRRIMIRDGITDLQTSAFQACTNLTELEIFPSLNRAGLRQAFSGCNKLSSIICMRLIGDSGSAQGTTSYLVEDENTGELVAFAKEGKTKTYSNYAESLDFSLVDGAKNLERLYLGPDTKLENAGYYSGGDKLTVYTYAGTQAETMCELFNIPHESVFYHDAVNTVEEKNNEVTVSASAKTVINIHNLTFDFENSAADFGYAQDYYLSPDCYVGTYQNSEFALRLRSLMYEKDKGIWQGNCFGMCAASLLRNNHLIETVREKEDGTMTSVPYLICNEAALTAASTASWYDGSSVKSTTSLAQIVEHLQAGQYSSLIQDTYQQYKNRLESILSLSAVDCGLYQEPFLIILGVGGKAHVVTAYAVVEAGKDRDRLFVYDPNRPGGICYITVFLEQGKSVGWEYEIVPGKMWNSSMEGALISAAPAASVVEMMNQMGHLENANAASRLTGAASLVAVDSLERAYLIIEDAAGNTAAVLKNGVFTSYDENVFAALAVEGNATDTISYFYMPSGGNYSIKNMSAEETKIMLINEDGSFKTEMLKPAKQSGGISIDNASDTSAGNAPDVSHSDTGFAVDPFVRTSADEVILQKGQSTRGLVVFMAEGDKISSVQSSRKKVAGVSLVNAFTGKIRIKGKKPGKAKITITLKSGCSKTVPVKVQKKKVKTKAVSITYSGGNSIILKTGKKVKLQVDVYPFTSQDRLFFLTSDSKVCTVSKKGVIEAKKTGTARITVRSGSRRKSIPVEVVL